MKYRNIFSEMQEVQILRRIFYFYFNSFLEQALNDLEKTWGKSWKEYKKENPEKFSEDYTKIYGSVCYNALQMVEYEKENRKLLSKKALGLKAGFLPITYYSFITAFEEKTPNIRVVPACLEYEWQVLVDDEKGTYKSKKIEHENECFECVWLDIRDILFDFEK